jgi:hypothetical protein
MRISLIGPGDLQYHFTELLNISQEETEQSIRNIGKVLAKSGADVMLTPDRGISFEVAKIFRENSPAGKVIGAVPMSDTEFGVGHLSAYMKAEVEGKPVFDEYIDSENWYKHDICLAAMGDCLLFLGKSLGSLGELALGFYIYKLFSKKKPGATVDRRSIGSHLQAGKVIPFTAIIYLPFVKERLDFELESYVEKVGGRVIHAKNILELGTIIGELIEIYSSKSHFREQNIKK